MNKIGQGLTRIWVVFVGLVELIIAAYFGVDFYNWLDHGHESFKDVTSPFIIGMGSVALAAYIIWFLARWIVRGFSD